MVASLDLVPLWRDAWSEPVALGVAGSATRKVRRGQTTVALLAVVLWLVGVIPELPGSGAAVRIVALLCVAACGYTLARCPAEPILLIVVTAVGGGVVLFAAPGIDSGSPMAPIWFDAAALAAGLGMSTVRRAIAAVAAVGLLSFASWLGLMATATEVPGGWRSAVGWTVATLGLGLGAAAAAGVVRMGARRLDAMAAATEMALTRDELAAAAQAEFFRATRLLHDTVINTLSAISRGVVRERLPQLHDRCSQDLALIDAAATERPGRDPVSAAAARARVLGIDLAVHGSPEWLEQVSEDALDLAGAAVSEALLNVSKHAGVAKAELIITPLSDAVMLQVVDHGKGWSGAAPGDGGISESILRRSEMAGLTASVRSEPGGGTTVALELPVLRSDSRHAALVFRPDARLMMALGCGSLLAEVAIRTVLTIGLAPALGAAVSCLLLAGVLVVAWRLSAGLVRPPAGASLLVAAVSLPIVLLLPQEGVGGLAWVWWGTVAAITVFLALAMLNSGVGWFAVAYGSQMAGRWVVDTADMSLLFPAGIVIAVGGLACVWIRRRILAMVWSYDMLAQNRDAARQRRLQASAGREESLALLRGATAAARLPLARVASGELRGDEPDLRAEAGRLAAHLRNVSRVGPDLGILGPRLLRLLEQARRLGVDTSFSVDPRMAAPPPRVAAALAGFTDRIAAHCVPGGALTITVVGRADGGFMSVMSRPSVLRPEDPALLRAAGMTVAEAGGDDDSWVELAWMVEAPPSGHGGTGSGAG